jgi:hypothetical protein
MDKISFNRYFLAQYSNRLFLAFIKKIIRYIKKISPQNGLLEINLTKTIKLTIYYIITGITTTIKLITINIKKANEIITLIGN